MQNYSTIAVVQLKLLPDLIDIGGGIINPVQVRAKGMDTEEIKQEFGKDLTFWGAIDTQKTLPMGSEKEVKEELEKRVDDLSCDGGYVLTSVHDIQADVPSENIVTVPDKARQC